MHPLNSCLCVAAALAMALPAAAAYPERPIQLVIPFTAGGGTDITGRTVGQCMEKYLGAGSRVLSVNRPGASGEIGLAYVANATPDGYVLGIANTPGLLTIPIERKAQFSLASFEFIANIVDDPGTLSVHADSAIKTIPDLVNAAKASPGKITVGTQGVGSAGHISVLLLERAAGIKLSPVPFQGASSARTALLAKDIQSTTANLGEALVFQQGQPWRILGVMSASRFPQSPDTPTFREAGYNITDTGSLRGLVAPKGTPKDIVGKLQDIAKKCVDNPEFRETARKTYQPLRYLPQAEYVTTLQQADARFRELWKVTPWNQ